MFERFTEKARRTIFFARYEASQFGASHIETEHLLLGIFREDKALANQFLGSFAKLEALRHSIEQRAKIGPKISTSVDLPLSHECKRVLAYAAEESDSMHHPHIGTPHLLLGLLREEKSFAAQLLREQGLTVDSVREQARQSEPLPPAASASIARIDRWLNWLNERKALGAPWTVEQKHVGNGTCFAIYAREEPPSRVPAVCIEIIGDDSFSTIQKRCNDYIAEGVAEVWLLDPNLKRAYTVTKTDGFREFKGEILKIARPLLEMDLKKVFD